MAASSRGYFCDFPPVDDEPAEPLGADELLGADDEDDPLGEVADDEDPLGDDDEDAPDEDDPLGEAAGLLDVSALAWTPSLEAVSASRRPVAFSPSFCWYSRSACCVFGPILPSISPGSAPLSFSACCTAFTCSEPPPPVAAPADLPLAEPDFMSLLDFVSLVAEPEDIEPEVLPAPELVAGDEPEVLLPPGDDFVSVLELADGGFLSAPELAAPPALLWANADVASNAPATVSAKALIHVFMTVLLLLGC